MHVYVHIYILCIIVENRAVNSSLFISKQKQTTNKVFQTFHFNDTMAETVHPLTVMWFFVFFVAQERDCPIFLLQQSQLRRPHCLILSSGP